MTHEAIIFAALWVSEGWHTLWENRSMLRLKRPLRYKARAVVVYDRVLLMSAQQRKVE